MRYDPVSHDNAVDRPRPHLSPIQAMLVKFEELDDYTDIAVRHYPKHERHLLSAETRQAVASIHRLIITAWKKYHKKTTLSELDIEIEVLRHLIRKALRKQYINAKRYQTWSAHVNELGAMLGGWIKSANSKH